MPEIELRGGALDGLRIHYVVDGRGPAVLLVHGLGGFAESWRHNTAYLGRHATVYAIDLPGFGGSGKPRAPYGLAFFAQALRRFVEATGLGRVTLVGHSLGGAVAVAYAATHPESLERLALVGAVVPGFGYRLPLAYRVLALRGVGELVSAWARLRAAVRWLGAGGRLRRLRHGAAAGGGRGGSRGGRPGPGGGGGALPGRRRQGVGAGLDRRDGPLGAAGGGAPDEELGEPA